MDGDRELLDALTDRRAETWLVDHLARVFAAGSVEEAWLPFADLMRDYGFDRVTYIYSPLSPDYDTLEDTLVLSNVSKRYIDEYVRKGHLRLALFLARAEAAGRDCMSWRPPPPETLSANERQALAMRQSYGFVAGYSISLRGLTGTGRAGVGLGARVDLDHDAVDRIWDRHGRTIILLNQALHLRISTLPHDLDGSALTARQSEVLHWVGAGKSVRDISVILGVTVATVEKHLRLARENLGAQTTAQAVMKGSVRNQIRRVDFSVGRKRPASDQE